MELKIGIEFEKEGLEQLDSLINKIQKLNEELSKLNQYEVLNNINNITINTSAIMGNEQEAREFALLLSKYINDETIRS